MKIKEVIRQMKNKIMNKAKTQERNKVNKVQVQKKMI